MHEQRRAYLDFCGEHYELDASSPLRIGRAADVVIDDNPYLHRRFLRVESMDDGFWWLINEGDRLPATVVATDTGLQASLPPGSRLPLFGPTTVVFTAGPTTYELDVFIPSARPRLVAGAQVPVGEQTLRPPDLTTAQRALIVALAEPLLLRDGTPTSAIPGSRAAAERLGWPLTKFNRKLDNVCDRFAQMGVTGLRGGPGRLASNRRVRLVEFALAGRLVTKSDLHLLDESAEP